MYLRRLLKFTNSKHQSLVAVAQSPEPVDCTGLADLHEGAGSTSCRWTPSFPGGKIRINKSTNLTNLSSLEWQRQSWVSWHRRPATWRCPCSVSSDPSARGCTSGGRSGRRTRRSCTRSGSPAQSLTPKQLVCQSCLPPQMSEPENYLLHWFGRFTYWARHRRGDYSDMMCENISFKRTLRAEFDIEGEDYSPCKSNSNCPKSLRHHPLGRRSCRNGCPTLIRTWYQNENYKRFNADVKTACVESVWSGCVHPWVTLWFVEW